MALRNVYVAGGNGIGYTAEVDSSGDYGSVSNDTYFKDLSIGVGGLILYKGTGGTVYPIFATNSVVDNGVKVTLSSVLNLTPSSQPVSGSAGDIYFDSGTNKLRAYNGSGWNDLW